MTALPSQPTDFDRVVAALAARIVTEATKALARDDEQPLTERVLQEYRTAGRATAGAVLMTLAQGLKGADTSKPFEAVSAQLRELAKAVAINPVAGL